MYCPVETGSGVEHAKECQRQVRNLHPPRRPRAADGVSQQQVSQKEAPSEKVEEDAGKALEEVGHWGEV